MASGSGTACERIAWVPRVGSWLVVAGALLPGLAAAALVTGLGSEYQSTFQTVWIALVAFVIVTAVSALFAFPVWKALASIRDRCETGQVSPGDALLATATVVLAVPLVGANLLAVTSLPGSGVQVGAVAVWVVTGLVFAAWVVRWWRRHAS